VGLFRPPSGLCQPNAPGLTRVLPSLQNGSLLPAGRLFDPSQTHPKTGPGSARTLAASRPILRDCSSTAAPHRAPRPTTQTRREIRRPLSRRHTPFATCKPRFARLSERRGTSCRFEILFVAIVGARIRCFWIRRSRGSIAAGSAPCVNRLLRCRRTTMRSQPASFSRVPADPECRTYLRSTRPLAAMETARRPVGRTWTTGPREHHLRLGGSSTRRANRRSTVFVIGATCAHIRRTTPLHAHPSPPRQHFECPLGVVPTINGTTSTRIEARHLARALETHSPHSPVHSIEPKVVLLHIPAGAGGSFTIVAVAGPARSRLRQERSRRPGERHCEDDPRALQGRPRLALLSPSATDQRDPAHIGP